MTRQRIRTVILILLFGAARPAGAQRITLGAGVNAGSIPRAMAPLCASARRLNGGGLSGQAGVVVQRLRLTASVDYLSNGGTMSVADCVPLPPGITVDSSYADAGSSALSFSADGWLRVAGPLDVGMAAGWVHNHQSWFIAPGVAAQVSRLRVEAVARRHTISFEEVTRNYDGTTVRELARREDKERSWGFAVRMLILGAR